MVGLQDLRSLIGAPTGRAPLGWLASGRRGAAHDADVQVERILAQARVDAENSGRPLDEVLREYGFDVKGSDGRGVAGELAAGADQVSGPALLGPLPEDAPDPQGLAVEDPEPLGALEDLLARVPPLEAADVTPFLAKEALGRLAARASFLGIVPRGAARTATAEDRWEALVEGGASLEALAALLQVEPWFPHVNGGLDLLDHLLGRDQLRFRAAQAARLRAEALGRPFWEVLVTEGGLEESAFLGALETFHGLAAAPEPKRFPRNLVEGFPTPWVRLFPLVPVRRAGGTIVVAASRPLPEAVRGALQAVLQADVAVQLAAPSALEAWRTRWLLEKRGPDSAMDPLPVDVQEADPGWAEREGWHRLPAPRLVERMLARARLVRATDIHVEPTEEGGQIRFRVDGICQPVLDLPRELFGELIARVKILADMDVTERRRPQDGNLVASTPDGERLNMRLSTVPSVRGEKLAIRLANAHRVHARLEELGLAPTHLELLRELASRPFGMLLATGPVGSGKTTTLYSCLQELERRKFNVMSIEDPVEIRLEGVTQLEANYGLGFGFAQGLRALLRQDPDAILVGEIRDQETAQIAVRASMTGLRVFSTLHTNDSTGAVTALRNFDLSPHLISSSLQGVIAQRLLRRLCPSCRESRRATAEDLRGLGVPELQKGLRAWSAPGCEDCLGTGYRGRIGIFEILCITPRIREMVLEGVGERTIREQAREDGLVTLQQDGLIKVAEGLTSLDEYRRVLNF